MNKIYFLFTFLFFISAPSFSSKLQAQDFAAKEWKLKKQDGKIKVYTRSHPDTKFKEIRITTNISVSKEILLDFMGDVQKYQDWVYKCSDSKLVKFNSKNDFYYYTKSDLPFPTADRDLVVHSKNWVDEVSGTIYSSSIAVNGMHPVEGGVVRITKFDSMWKLIPQPDGTINIDYTALTDPGGYLPAWVVNLGVSIGPLRSMKKFTQMVESLELANVEN